MLKDVMPLVEAKYRVKPGRENRAIAGLSMGGGQTIAIGFRHLDLFSAIGAFSAAIPGDFEKEFAETIANPKDVNAKLKVLWFACGKQDCLFERSKILSDLLATHQIKHAFHPTEGVHNYTVWRKYLGWDPVSGKLRAWIFDSEGGYGEGTWHRDGDSWVLKTTGVTADGQTASGTSIYTFVSDAHHDLAGGRS